LLPALDEEFVRLRTVAAGNLTISIRGESGTGKELIATAIHALSGRPGPFLALNCGALPANLVASELFGYRKGAFSGAEEDRPGLFRSAERGTLLLDEIGELPLDSQAALLRVLQEGEVLPLGGTRPVPVDVRVLSATSRDLGALAEQGRFRRDLYQRLAGYAVTLPSLRERAEDIGLIIAALLRKLSKQGADPLAFTADAVRALLRYEWPGNVRELEHCLRAALLLAGHGRIDVSHLAPGPRLALGMSSGEQERPRPPLSDEQVKQKEELTALLTRSGGNVSAVARQLGKDRVQLQRWLRRLELDARTFRR
jgi:transcriptional regulator with GAF, ATPase, and Fis domain